MGGADRDVAELAEVAEGDLAGGVDAVVANPVMGRCLGQNGLGLDASVESHKRASSVECAVGSVVVVVLAEGVELELEVGERLGGDLLG